jgi:hypothetical protein
VVGGVDVHPQSDPSLAGVQTRTDRSERLREHARRAAVPQPGRLRVALSLTASTPATGCATEGEAKTKGVIVGMVGAGVNSITALLPDGGSARVEGASGRSRKGSALRPNGAGLVSANVSAGDTVVVESSAGSQSLTAPTEPTGTAAAGVTTSTP